MSDVTPDGSGNEPFPGTPAGEFPEYEQPFSLGAEETTAWQRTPLSLTLVVVAVLIVAGLVVLLLV